MLRRDLLRVLGATALVLPLLPVLPGCDGGSDDTGGDDTGDTDDTGTDTADSTLTCSLGDSSGESNFHGHTISVPVADLQSPTGDVTYTSSGGGHTHTVLMTAAERQALVDDCEVTVSSTSGGHAHTWLVQMPS